MKSFRLLMMMSLALWAVIGARAVAQSRSSSNCDCPKDDPSTHGRVETIVDKELSSSVRSPESGDLRFPKALTVCMFFDPTDKGYPTDLRLILDGSLDGRTWFPLTLAGSRNRAEGQNTCLAVTPVRYVRVGWPAGSTIPSPGPRVTVQAQASY